ncbi:hypothetical protein [Caenimonas sedimenti]|uniref:hypothetical protein n=1 Tax=Caenimonas sedimenti TaxID=2596921 RepID=UPI00119D998C|nr:hypothetical protein [Caenimonas sedimenti]
MRLTLLFVDFTSLAGMVAGLALPAHVAQQARYGTCRNHRQEILVALFAPGVPGLGLGVLR